ncbi:MAG TPA: hypothetical protein VGO93_08495 [Candidatus Xenobia bacterium]|jgi:hypothetical protein
MQIAHVSLPAWLTPRLSRLPSEPLLQHDGDRFVLSLPAPRPPQLDDFGRTSTGLAGFDLHNFRMLPQERMSGSAQYSPQGLDELVQQLPHVDPKNIFLCDLREEPHLMVDGLPVSWQLPARHTFDSHLEPWLLAQTRKLGSAVESEVDAVHKLGAHALRYHVFDSCAPSRQVINQFVHDMRGLPPDAWVHFHCAGGMGRTTTFMCLRDMMLNAKRDSFEDILSRQARLGGMDLLHVAHGDARAQGRLEVLQHFYQYCKTNSDGFQTLYN